MSKELVSIVMPSYNRQTYLPECIRSIQAQTYKNWELIIVDDGSTDDSKMLYDFYINDKRIRVIYGEHSGIASARNLGIEYAKGEYIAVFDSDDVMFPERLEEEVKMMKKYDFCSSWYLISDKDLNQQATKLATNPKFPTYKDVKNNGSWAHFCIMAYRKCFLEHPYRSEMRVNDDAFLVWDWFRAGYTNINIEKPLAIQRGHSGNTSKKAKEIQVTQELINKEYEEWESCTSQLTKSQK